MFIDQNQQMRYISFYKVNSRSKAMGCVSSQSTNDRKKKSMKELNRDSFGNPLDDIEAAKRRDQKAEDGKTSKKVEEVSKKNQELNKQIQKLKKQNQIKKKQSKESIEERQKQMRRLEIQKNKQIQRLRKELQMQKQKQKEKQQSNNKVDVKFNVKQQKVVGLASLLDHKALCEECFYKLPRYTATNPSMNECMSCRGYGLSMDRFPFGANPSCEKALCFKKGWENVKSLRLCTICNGKGGHQGRVVIGRRF